MGWLLRVPGREARRRACAGSCSSTAGGPSGSPRVTGSMAVQVARTTAATPPRPMALASAPASRRRVRSSAVAATASNRSLISASRLASMLLSTTRLLWMQASPANAARPPIHFVQKGRFIHGFSTDSARIGLGAPRAVDGRGGSEHLIYMQDLSIGHVHERHPGLEPHQSRRPRRAVGRESPTR